MWTSGDSSTAWALGEKITGAADAVGKLKRDVELLRRKQSQWPSGMKAEIDGLQSNLGGMLVDFDRWAESLGSQIHVEEEAAGAEVG